MFMHDFDLLLDKVGRVCPYRYVLFFGRVRIDPGDVGKRREGVKGNPSLV